MSTVPCALRFPFCKIIIFFFQGDSAESAPPATSASATSASPHPVNETEVSTDNADNTDAQPAKVRALVSEPAAPGLPPSLTDEQGLSSPHTQQPADVSPHFDSQPSASNAHTRPLHAPERHKGVMQLQHARAASVLQ